MIVVMQQGATEPQVQAVIDRLVGLGFDVHRSTGVIHTLLGGVGGKDDFDLAMFEVMDGVKEALRIASPYKLASRSFRPGGTVVKIGDVEIGGERVVVMAGPCSVESREQIERSADLVAAAGAQVIRGGAFKPRSSPYSFQGSARKGSTCCARRPAGAGCWWSARSWRSRRLRSWPSTRTFSRWARATCRTSTCCANWAGSASR